MHNENIEILEKKLLSDNWYKLYKIVFNQKENTGSWARVEREAYDRGNGAVVLLYNSTQGTVVLTQQFRIPTYINGNADGMLIEACAGLLDDLNPEDCIRKEIEEETGYRIHDVKKIFECYMSPGSVTEKLHFFIAEYDPKMKVSAGGGLDGDHENINVLEFKFEEAWEMISTGKICDAKTILLLYHFKLFLLSN